MCGPARVLTTIRPHECGFATGLCALLGLALLICGVAGGFYIGAASSKAASTAMNSQAISDASEAIVAARNSTSSLEYEQALWRFLALLKSDAPRKNSTLEDWAIATDTALTYAHLSDLAAEQGLAEKSQLLLTKAVEQCPRMKLEGCTAARILFMARALLVPRFGLQASATGPGE